MKIIFINPPISGYNIQDLFESEPLGLAYLGAFLEKEGFDVEILDCFAKGIHQVYKTGGLLRRGLTNHQIKDHLRQMNPDVIGIHSQFTMFFPDASEVAGLVRDLYPQNPIVFGGAHATMDSKSIVETGIADVVVRGEGEITVVELLYAFKKGAPIKDILGLTYRDSSGEVCMTPDRPLIEDIDTLPQPAWHKLDMDIYLKYSKVISPFSMNYPVASLITSRGCPYDCIFCSTKNMWKRKWRADSPQKVVDEIEFLVRHYGVKEIIIQDDNFIVNKKRIETICDLLIEKNLGITLHNPAGLTAWTVDYDLLKKMMQAGFYRVLLPVETGNPKTLTFIRKRVNLEKVLETVKMANKLGLWTQANFIIGFPYETKEDILITIRYAFKSGFDFAAFLIAQPFAGAEMYDIFKKEGLLNENSINKRSIFFKTQFDTKYLKAEEIQQLRDCAAGKYLKKRVIALLNPVYFFNYFWPKINSLSKFKYFIRIVLFNFNFIFNRYRKNDIK